MKAQINCTAPSRALTLSTLKLFRNKVTYEVMFVSKCSFACTEGLLHTHKDTLMPTIFDIAWIRSGHR